MAHDIEPTNEPAPESMEWLRLKRSTIDTPAAMGRYSQELAAKKRELATKKTPPMPAGGFFAAGCLMSLIALAATIWVILYLSGDGEDTYDTYTPDPTTTTSRNDIIPEEVYNPRNATVTVEKTVETTVTSTAKQNAVKEPTPTKPSDA